MIDRVYVWPAVLRALVLLVASIAVCTFACGGAVLAERITASLANQTFGALAFALWLGACLFAAAFALVKADG